MNTEEKTETIRTSKPPIKPKSWRNVPAHIFLTVGALIVIFPFIWMLLTAFKTEPEAIDVANFRFFPHQWQWENFSTLFQQHPMATYYFNSAIYTILRSLPSIFLASLTGFLIAKFWFRGRTAIWFLIIATLIIPFQVRLIPMANMLFSMGMKNEYWGVVLPGMLEPFGIFLFIQACRAIPDELLESARIDGCGIWRQYVHVALPLIGPTLAAYAIIMFMWSWGEFLWSFIVVTETARMPLEVGIKGFSGEHYSTVVHMMSAATVAVVPVVVVFLALQRLFVRGVTMSGLKA